MYLVYNEQTGDFEEKLYKDPPEITFQITNSGEFVFKDEEAHLKWSVKDADSLTLDGIELDIQNSSQDIKCDEVGRREFILVAKNPCGETKKSLSVFVIEKTYFEIRLSKPKLRKGKNETCEVEWNIHNASSATLITGRKKNEIPLSGTTSLSPKNTKVLRFEALANDGQTIFSEEIKIGVYEECSIQLFKADKLYVFPQIPIKLSWNTKHAKHVWLGDEEVNARGSKKIKQDKETIYVLKAEDEFGIKEERICVQMLPIPQVKSLLVPTPQITNNLSVSIKQPRYNVSLRMPNIHVMGVDLQLPHVPSLKDKGLMVDLSLPELKRPGLLKEFKSLFSYYYNKIKHA
ncbi:MAG: hypothetical protein J6Y04_01195 [Bacteroidaceae bacterium]|nr:hypothetical protein [Bacteroidaceae bacterium]